MKTILNTIPSFSVKALHNNNCIRPGLKLSAEPYIVCVIRNAEYAV